MPCHIACEIWHKEADEAGLIPVETSAILKVPCVW